MVHLMGGGTLGAFNGMGYMGCIKWEGVHGVHLMGEGTWGAFNGRGYLA